MRSVRQSSTIVRSGWEASRFTYTFHQPDRNIALTQSNPLILQQRFLLIRLPACDSVPNKQTNTSRLLSAERSARQTVFPSQYLPLSLSVHARQLPWSSASVLRPLEASIYQQNTHHLTHAIRSTRRANRHTILSTVSSARLSATHSPWIPTHSPPIA